MAIKDKERTCIQKSRKKMTDNWVAIDHLSNSGKTYINSSKVWSLEKYIDTKTKAVIVNLFVTEVSFRSIEFPNDDEAEIFIALFTGKFND